MIIKIIVEYLSEELPILLEHKRGDDAPSAWASIEAAPFLSVYMNSDGSVGYVEKDVDITTKDDSIISQFIEQYQDVIVMESSGISADDDSKSDAPDDIQPYDPELIRVDTRPFTLKHIFELIEDGDIDLSPDFQRHFVWKEAQKKSRLIESIMLRIPLPVFYLSQDKEGKFQVVDGLQRLTVIKQYLNNEFRLSDLEYLKECEGCYYSLEDKKKLDPKYVRRISQTQFVVNIIDPQTPTRVKFEIFKRLNQGGKPLKPQEIRNCMANTNVRNFINELTSSAEFLLSTDYSVNPIRMEDQELVLRFVGFYYEQFYEDRGLKYTGSMESFLDDTLSLLNNLPSDEIKDLKVAFTNAMKNAYYLFGKYSFRKCSHEHLSMGAKKQLINKSLFTVWSVLLSRAPYGKVLTLMKPNCLNFPLADRIVNDEDYYFALSYATNDVLRLGKSFSVARSIMAEELKKHDKAINN